jgi:tripartite-type tricarboxylate transporter receptor subunit TctC
VKTLPVTRESSAKRTFRWWIESAAWFCGAVAFSCATAWAQPYPAKPVHVLTLFVPGSTGDTTARIWCASLANVLGQPVLLDNVPGAGGVLAAERVSKAAPDGHTLLFSLSSVHVFRSFLSRNTPFHPVNDFTPITELGETITLLVANASAPFGSLRDMLDYAKANPGKLAYGTSGVGSPTHLAGELIKQLTGVEMVHVPYKGVAQALQDSIAGQIPLSYAIAGLAWPAFRSGRIKVLAVTGETRYPRMPDVPTLAEALPGYESVPSWTGVFAPPHLPQVLLKRLHADIVKSVGVPEVRAKLAEGDFQVITNTPEEFLAKIRRETEHVGRIVRRAGIQPVD